MNVSLQMLRRRVFPSLFLLLLLFPCSEKSGQTSPAPSAPPEPAKEDPLADVVFSRCPYETCFQKTAEKLVNQEYYAKRPDPRKKEFRPLSREGKKRVLELIPKLGDDSWEVRRTAHCELEKYCPAAVPLLKEHFGKEPDLEIRYRLGRMLTRFPYGLPGVSANKLLALARAEFERDPLTSFWINIHAARMKPHLANDSWLRWQVQKAFDKVEVNPKDDALDDTALYMLADFDRLVKRFPDSPFVEDILFRLGEYEALLSAFPEGKYRPYTLYSHICGHWYFDPDRGLKFRNRAREIKMWPEFLEEFPDHPGANDAWYRYGRALEEEGRYIEAIRALAKARDTGEQDSPFKKKYDWLPNDTYNIRNHARDRICYILDALISIEELDGIKDEFADDDELRTQCIYTYGMRCFRAGRFEEAREIFRTIVEWHKPEKEAQSDETDETESLFKYSKRKIEWLDNDILPHWRAYQKDPNAPDAAGHLFRLGRTFQKKRFSLYHKGHDTRMYFTYWGFTAKGRKDNYLESSNYVAAAKYFCLILTMYPQSGWREQALLELSNCFRKLADDYFYRFDEEDFTREQCKTMARALFMELFKDIPPRKIAEITRDSWEEWQARPP